MRDYKVINGDLLRADADVICHQVNCQGAMRSGVAKAIRERYPQVYADYSSMCNTTVYKDELLGNAQMVKLNNGEVKPSMCVNMFTQLNYGYNGSKFTSEQAFKLALDCINTSCSGLVVAFPWKIGCVRGGADWNVILPLICEVLTDVKEIVFYKLDLG